MAPMGKEDMIRLFIKPLPWDLFFSSVKLPDFFLFFALCYRMLVALQADRHSWHSRKILGFEVAVAGVALHPLGEMFLMIKEDGLIGLRP
jgi:hypothetical protein